MSKALDPGEAVGEAVHVLKGDQRASRLLVPSRLVSRSNCKCVKTNHFIRLLLMLYMFVLLAATSSMLWSTGPLHNSDLRDI